jgi:esterase/lipase superfamily enzyme
MELKVYGTGGKSLLVFPCAGGRFYEFEDFKMTEVVEPFLREGRIKVFTIDSLDNQTWLNPTQPVNQRAARHDAYDKYLLKEIIPFIHNHQKNQQGIMTFGCSLGAYHALNFHLRHPDVVDSSLSLSGVYSLKHFIGDRLDESSFYHSPLDFFPGLTDEWFLSRLRDNKITLCVGQGAWEDECLRDTLAMKKLFEEKQIPAWVDIWGYDVNHDWPWWLVQLPYFLNKLLP